MSVRDDFPEHFENEDEDEEEDDEFYIMNNINELLPFGSNVEQGDNDDEYLFIHDNQILFRLNERALQMFQLTLLETERHLGEDWKYKYL